MLEPTSAQETNFCFSLPDEIPKDYADFAVIAIEKKAKVYSDRLFLWTRSKKTPVMLDSLNCFESLGQLFRKIERVEQYESEFASLFFFEVDRERLEAETDPLQGLWRSVYMLSQFIQIMYQSKPTQLLYQGAGNQWLEMSINLNNQT